MPTDRSTDPAPSASSLAAFCRRPGGPLAPRPVALRCPRVSAQVPAAGDQLCFMALDVIDEGQVGGFATRCMGG